MPAGSTPLIYNIPTNQWVHDFEVSAPPTTSVTPLPTGVTPPGKSSNMGGAIGGAVGGVVVIAAIGFFFYRRHKKAPNNASTPSVKNSDYDGHGRFGKREGLFGRSNRNSDDYDREYSNKDTVQLQETVTKRGTDEIPYHSSSSPFESSSSSAVSFMRQSSAPPLPRTVGTPPPSSMLSHSAMLVTPPSPSPLAVLQRGGGATGSPPSEQPQYFGYYGGRKEDPSIPLTNAQSHSAIVAYSNSPQYVPASVAHSNSPQYVPTSVAYSNSPQYVPASLDGYGIEGESSGRAEPRRPQQFGSADGMSPAANLFPSQISGGVPHVSQSPVPAGFSRWDSTKGGLHYPPPPGQQLAQPENSDMMQKKLKLMKAQHELDLERIRLEQESQVQLMERQFKHGP